MTTKYPMTEVIAMRHIPWRSADGARATVEVCLGTPAPDKADGGDWYCPYEIKFLAGEERITDWSQIKRSMPGTGKMLVQRHAFGVDSVQALCLALQIIGVEISTLAGSPDGDGNYPDWADSPNFGFFVPLITENN